MNELIGDIMCSTKNVLISWSSDNSSWSSGDSTVPPDSFISSSDTVSSRPSQPARRTAVEWLDRQVAEVCREGREVLT